MIYSYYAPYDKNIVIIISRQYWRWYVDHLLWQSIRQLPVLAR